jgi:hypothetical protein
MHHLRIGGNRVHRRDDNTVDARLQNIQPAPVALPYAPRPPKYQRIVTRLAASILMCATILILAHDLPFLWRRAKLLYWQHQCMTYQPNPKSIVARWDARGALNPLVPIAWQNYYPLLSPPGGKSDGTAFLGERVSPSGHRRLVVVELERHGGPPEHGRQNTITWNVYFMARVIQPGTINREPQELTRFGGQSNVRIREGAADMVLVGIQDPLDHSHFTIRLRQGGRTSRLEGWLCDNEKIEWTAGPASATEP